jgi:hypothetical protein
MCNREVGIKELFKECSEVYNIEKIKNIRYNLDDRGSDSANEKIYSFCYDKTSPFKIKLKSFCGPDYSFHSWSDIKVFSFETTKNEIIIEANKEPSINKVGWIGNINTPQESRIEHKTRRLLKSIGDKNDNIFDIKHVNIFDIKHVNGPNDNKFLTFAQLTKYKYLIDIGGNGWSGRLKFLLFTKRPLLLVDRQFVDYFYEDLIPYIHYIPVKIDLSDLLEQVIWIQQNEEKSKEIANNAYEFAINNFQRNKLMNRIYEVYENMNN